MEKFTDQQDFVVEHADFVCISDIYHKENSKIRSQWIIFNGDINTTKQFHRLKQNFWITTIISELLA